MPVEGWDGRSVADHVEEAKRDAGNAHQLARDATDELEKVSDRLDQVESHLVELGTRLDRLADGKEK
ncbi:hypothetical protein [Paracoccus onubensis]|uniref:Uncharacterized protein n=1 Tax=Paracoccus onubensis TaxID=1675788 RepID=A0A418SX27_9RHOB|nr:hypothetical protein [Paracoccus onubensis]RJE85455.1 hypothetical protein D3P04_10660 [Paracoccus onubensis]